MSSEVGFAPAIGVKQVVDNVFGVLSGRLRLIIVEAAKSSGGALFQHNQAKRDLSLVVGPFGDVVHQKEEQRAVGHRSGLSMEALRRVDEGEPVKRVFRLRSDGTMRGGPVGFVVHDHPQLFIGMRFITDSDFRIALAAGFSPSEIEAGCSGAPELVIPKMAMSGRRHD